MACGWSTSCLVRSSGVGIGVIPPSRAPGVSLLQFDRVHVEYLVAELDLIHVPTAAGIGFGLTASPALRKGSTTSASFSGIPPLRWISISSRVLV